MWRLSATTTATPSPTLRTFSDARQRQVWRAGSGPKSGIGSHNSAASAPVMTATTPGNFRAAATSIPMIRAWAWGLRTMAAWSMRGRTRSSMYPPRPRRSRGSSTRGMDLPTHLRSVGCSRTAGMVCLLGGFPDDDGHALGGGQHRLDDELIAGAATEVAGDALADLGGAGAGVLPEQLEGEQEHRRGAEPALQALLLPERLLQRVEFAVGGEPLHGLDLGAVGLDGEHEAGADALAVHEHRAGAAHAVLASDVGADQPEVLAQELDEGAAGFDL